MRQQLTFNYHLSPTADITEEVAFDTKNTVLFFEKSTARTKFQVHSLWRWTVLDSWAVPYLIMSALEFHYILWLRGTWTRMCALLLRETDALSSAQPPFLSTSF